MSRVGVRVKGCESVRRSVNSCDKEDDGEIGLLVPALHPAVQNPCCGLMVTDGGRASDVELMSVIDIS